MADRFAGIWRPGDRLIAVDADATCDGKPIVDWRTVDLAAIDGGFALAWSDGEALTLARDAIGHRSLYWARRPDGGVAFASTLRGVDVVRRLDPGALAAYLTCAYIPGEATLIRGLRAVSPGTELRIGPATTASRTFWSLPAATPSGEPEDALRDGLRRTLEQAVDRALPDGPVVATLSGGIDSSLVVALAAKKRPLTALSVSFGPEHRDELAFSAAVAAHCGVAHRVVTVTPADIISRFDATVAALSAPNGDPLTVPNDRLFAAARAHGDVVLNGEGGDPCFGGPKNAPMLLAELYDADAGDASAYLRAHQRCWDDLDAMLGPGDHGVETLVTPWLEDPRYPAYLDRLMAINVAWKGAWHILPKVDSLGAPHGVRPRSPLFERQIVERAFALPAAMKRNGTIEKYLLKEAARDLLPAAIIDRPKSGMMVPVEAWFDGPLAGWARERLLDGLTAWDLVDRRYLERLLARRTGGLRPRRGVKIWLLLTLEAWLRGVIGGPR